MLGAATCEKSWAAIQRRVKDRLGERRSRLNSQSHQVATEGSSRVTSSRAGRRAILSIGGDGTHSEIAGGILEATREHRPSRGVGLHPCGHRRRLSSHARLLIAKLTFFTQSPPAHLNRSTQAKSNSSTTKEQRIRNAILSTLLLRVSQGLSIDMSAKRKQASGRFGASLSYVSPQRFEPSRRMYASQRGAYAIDGKSLGNVDGSEPRGVQWSVLWWWHADRARCELGRRSF